MKKPLAEFIKIQDLQFKLDKLKSENQRISKEIRSLSQIIPKLIRELTLK